MNKWVGMGRLTGDPEVRRGNNDMVVAKYRLAIDRRGKDTGADFIPCTVFGKGAEFAEKYLHKGTKVAVSGRIKTDFYENRDKVKVYTTEVIIDEQEFAESKKEEAKEGEPKSEDFMSIPEGVDELPFN
jgi:single-strand DNA-binding protein